MRYYLKIGNTVFNNVSALTVAGSYRTENVTTTITGNYIVDRIGGEKLKITATINLLTESEMDALRAAREAMFVDVTFDRGNTRTAKTMRLSDFTEPSPLYFYGDKSKGYRYGTVTITAEEK